jgi:hypothetical protein
VGASPGGTVNMNTNPGQQAYYDSGTALPVAASANLTLSVKATDPADSSIVNLKACLVRPDRSGDQADTRADTHVFKNLGVDRIAPLHCTGFEAMKNISDRFVGFELMPAGSEIEL